MQRAENYNCEIAKQYNKGYRFWILHIKETQSASYGHSTRMFKPETLAGKKTLSITSSCNLTTGNTASAITLLAQYIDITAMKNSDTKRRMLLGLVQFIGILPTP